MQKRKIEFHDDYVAVPDSPVRLATSEDLGVESAARRLQNDLARVLAKESTWSVRRTVALGTVFHVVVLTALGLAASGMLQHIRS